MTRSNEAPRQSQPEAGGKLRPMLTIKKLISKVVSKVVTVVLDQVWVSVVGAYTLAEAVKNVSSGMETRDVAAVAVRSFVTETREETLRLYAVTKVGFKAIQKVANRALANIALLESALSSEEEVQRFCKKYFPTVEEEKIEKERLEAERRTRDERLSEKSKRWGQTIRLSPLGRDRFGANHHDRFDLSDSRILIPRSK